MYICVAIFLKSITMKTVNLKTILVVLVLVFASINVLGQNIQLHYDFARKCTTSTIEMFRPDKAGSTFFFVDIDFNPKVKGVYGEISREFCFWQESKWDWLSVHVEYNGGMDGGFSFNNNWLGGLTYSGHSDDWSKTWSVSAMYKLIPGAVGFAGYSSNHAIHNFQITGVWNLDFFDHWLSFNGFFDFWREIDSSINTEYIFVSEPQLWVNLKKVKGMEDVDFSVGTEVELAVNFAGNRGFKTKPTLAVKYAF